MTLDFSVSFSTNLTCNTIRNTTNSNSGFFVNVGDSIGLGYQ